jgi:VIT1/CCC1 family predicted Fe2+/Mn2+ transporter
MGARKSWGQEMESVFLYRALADCEPAPGRRDLFTKLAVEAEAQAALWATEVRKIEGKEPSGFRPSGRARMVAALVRRLGPRRLRGVLAAMKVRGMSVYAGEPAGGHEMPHSLEEVGLRHRGVVGGDTLRPAVFGVSDGLVSNVCLILGVAGASQNHHAPLVAGAAGLLAGAFSMAAGEYVSVRSQREMFEHQIGAERAELRQYPAAEAAELSLIYQARGVAKDDADRISIGLVADPERALETLAREELGLDPSALGSPVAAAWSSFASFALGAAVPLVPFAVGPARLALGLSVALTAAALFGVGCAISLFTGRGAARAGARTLLIGAAAGAVTYAVGRLVGMAV